MVGDPSDATLRNVAEPDAVIVGIDAAPVADLRMIAVPAASMGAIDALPDAAR